MSSRNKTLRKSHSDVSGVRIDYSVNEGLQKLLETEANSAYRKPWHRLERGLRVNRLRLFAQDMKERRGLKESEYNALFTLLVKALDKKGLNSKTEVIYEPATERITEIKHLVMHQNAEGDVLFQLVEKRNAVTFRKRQSSPPQTPEQPPPPQTL
jgi:hypothetical protein